MSVQVDVNASYGADTASVLSAGFGSGLVSVIASVALYETGPELVHAPALVCYGGGEVSLGAASVSAAAVTLSGAGSGVSGAASVSAGAFTVTGEGAAFAEAARVNAAEVFIGGAGEIELGAAGTSAAVAFVGAGFVALGEARVSADDEQLAGLGELLLAAPVLLPKSIPGRVALTARPTASVVAWAVPR